VMIIQSPSVLSQFQGALGGATLGAAWGESCQSCSSSVELWQLNQLKMSPIEASLPSLKLLDAIADYVANTEILRFDDSGFSELLSNMETRNLSCTAEVTLSILPIVLLCHGDIAQIPPVIAKSTQTLSHIARSSTLESLESLTERLWITAITWAIVLQRPKLSCIIPSILECLQHSPLANTQPLFVYTNLFMRVHTFWQQGTELSALLHHLKQSDVSSPLRSLMMSLYSFLTSPTHLSLVLVRAAKTEEELRLTCAIAGSLFGLYNGNFALLSQWNAALGLQQSSFPLPTDEMSNLDPLTVYPCLQRQMHLASQLFASWAGVYQRITDAQFTRSSLTITAPGSRYF
jgi:hypothetical protein